MHNKALYSQSNGESMRFFVKILHNFDSLGIDFFCTRKYAVLLKGKRSHENPA